METGKGRILNHNSIGRKERKILHQKHELYRFNLYNSI